jgi:hypothetical protein
MLLVTAVVVVLLVIATIKAVLGDGHGKLPPEPTQRTWTAGHLPSEPYSSKRLT